MKILITGSAGHLGEALMRTLQNSEQQAIGLDIKTSPFTQLVGSIVDRGFVKECMQEAEAVIHTATLHKPHIATHSRQDFVDTNITGTLNLLEEAVSASVTSFVYTSTTSAFGRALTPPEGAPAAWITEEVVPVPKNIYGVTKVAAENLCELIHHKTALPCLVLRTSRFFLFEAEYARRGWTMPQNIDRVYVNELARTQLDWRPRHDFRSAIRSLHALEDFRSPLARAVGSKVQLCIGQSSVLQTFAKIGCAATSDIMQNGLGDKAAAVSFSSHAVQNSQCFIWKDNIDAFAHTIFGFKNRTYTHSVCMFNGFPAGSGRAECR